MNNDFDLDRIIDVTIKALNDYGKGHESDLELVNTAKRLWESKRFKKIKEMKAQEYEALTPDIKTSVDKCSQMLRAVYSKPYMFKRQLASIMTKMYSYGIADAIGGEVVEEGRCVNIDKGEKYEIACPYCGEVFDIDMEAMLPDSGGYGVKI